MSTGDQTVMFMLSEQALYRVLLPALPFPLALSLPPLPCSLHFSLYLRETMRPLHKSPGLGN